MNAFNNVNLAAACILTSTEYAEELGVSEDKWIYPLGGAGTQDSENCKYIIEYSEPHLAMSPFPSTLSCSRSMSIYILKVARLHQSDMLYRQLISNTLPVLERPNYHSSPSISHTLDVTLSISKLTSADIDFFDFYS